MSDSAKLSKGQKKKAKKAGKQVLSDAKAEGETVDLPTTLPEGAASTIPDMVGSPSIPAPESSLPQGINALQVRACPMQQGTRSEG